MPYRYLDEIAIADVAFEARGDTKESMFMAAATATMNVMVEDPNSIAPVETRTILVEADALDMLLFQFLGEFLFYKDAELLLLLPRSVEIEERDGKFTLTAQASGERLDLDRHKTIVDVKAVTMHLFEVARTDDGWKSTVVLDI